MSEIAILTVKVSTLGEGGSAVGSETTIPLQGFLLDAYIDYDENAPATTDVTISDPTFGDILVVASSVTRAWYAPRKATCDAAAAATGLYDLIPLNSTLTISVTQADELPDCVTVTLRFVTP